MSRWPASPKPLETNPGYEGPLNVFIEKHGIAEGINRATETKKQYDANHPGAPAVMPAPPPPAPQPLGPPISAGRAIVYDRPHVIVRQTFKDRRKPGT